MEALAARDVIAPRKDVHEAVELDDEARGVPDRGVVVGAQAVLEPQLPEVAHDVPRQGLAVRYEQGPLGFAGLDEPLQEGRLPGAVAAPQTSDFLIGSSMTSLVRVRNFAWSGDIGSTGVLVVRKGGVDLGVVIHLAVGEYVGVHVQRWPDAI